MSAAPLFPLFALCRHRMGSDGAGVTTLTGGLIVIDPDDLPALLQNLP